MSILSALIAGIIAVVLWIGWHFLFTICMTIFCIITEERNDPAWGLIGVCCLLPEVAAIGSGRAMADLIPWAYHLLLS